MKKLLVLITILILWQTGLTVAFVQSNKILADYAFKKFSELKPIEWVMMRNDEDGFPVFMSVDGHYLRTRDGEFEWDFEANEFIPVVYPSAALAVGAKNTTLHPVDVKPVSTKREILGTVKEKGKHYVIITDTEGKNWKIHDDRRIEEV